MPLMIIALLVLSGSVKAETEAVPDSTQAFPPRAKYRSTAETIAALPGNLIYLPIGLAGYAARTGFAQVYEKRLVYRFNNLLTFYQGRAGIRLLSSSGLGAGGHVFFNDLLLGGNARFATSFGSSPGQRRYHTFSLAWPHRFQFTAHFSKDPKNDFNGVGTGTRAKDKTSFGREDLLIQVTQRTPLGAGRSVHLDVHYSSIDIGPGKSGSAQPLRLNTPAGANLPGLEQRASFAVVALSLHADRVDVPGSPTRGNRTTVRLAYKQSIDSNDYSHLRAAVISEQFFELFYRRTLSLRLGTDWRYAPGGHKTPFYDLAELGGLKSLRGYRPGRFRDRGNAFGTATYKFPIWKLIEGAVFYDVGRTLGEPGDFGFDHWEDSYGASVRLWVPQGLLGELSLARSSEEQRILFNFKTGF